MAAAVADYRPAEADDPSKRPRTGEPWDLRLVPTPDLVAGLAAISRADQAVIGFALEPADRLLENARGKLEQKSLAAIVANPLETIDSQDIRAIVLLRDGRTLRPPGGAVSKREFARWLLDQLEVVTGLRLEA